MSTSSALRRARQRSHRFRQQRRSQGHGSTPYTVPLAATRSDPGPEQEFIYWYPDRLGIRHAPADLLATIRRDVHPSLDVTWSPIHERWLVWNREPRAQNPLCPGWALVFVWEHPLTRGYLALDPQLLGFNLYLCMRDKVGTARECFDRVEAQIARTKAARHHADTNSRHDFQRELLRSRRISNIGAGNKFALHHDGTVVPSRGEANWSRERIKWAIPADIQRRIDMDTERKRDAGMSV
jgi:hypothetical protein